MTSTAPAVMRALVVTITDDADSEANGIGQIAAELLHEAGFGVDGTVVVDSDAVAVRAALNTGVIGGVDLVVTIGATGVAPRDIAPEVTTEVVDRELHGLCEALRFSAITAGLTDAVISRGVIGVSGSTLIANVAASRAAVRDGMATLLPLAQAVIAEISDPGIED